MVHYMSSKYQKLAHYRKKRDFGKTNEPEGAKRAGKGPPIFVIQEHEASTLHYDFRLQVDGVLKSWAVPKGPSTDPREKRLAIPTEDHPLEYADFEGVIPQDEYGGGTVIVWDTGTYRNLKHDDQNKEMPLASQLEGGHLAVWLEGRKLKGGYALIRTGRGEKSRWLLVKMNDEGADARRKPVNTQPKSVLSGRTLKQVSSEEGGEAP